MIPLLGLSIGFPSINIASLATALFALVVKQFEAGVEATVRDTLGAAFADTTNPGLGTGDWFSSMAGSLAPVAELVVAPMLFAATIGAVLRQDMRRLARAWFVCLPVAMIAGAAIVQLASLALSVTNALSSAIQAAVVPNLGSVFTRALVISLVASAASGGILGILLCLLFLVGAVAIWLELALRTAAIDMAVLFMPLAFAGLVWPATAHWARKMLEVLAALLLAKPIIVGTLCLGARAVTSANGFSSAVEGLAVLLLSAFTPFAVLKLIPIADAHAVGHLEGLARAPMAAAQRTMQRGLAIAGSVAGAPELAAAAGVASSGGGLTGAALHLLSQMGGRGKGSGGTATGGVGLSGAEGDPGMTVHPLGPARNPGEPLYVPAGSEGPGRG